MSQSNEICSLCEVCKDDLQSLQLRLIAIADARLYNIRYGLGRRVDYSLYRLLREYQPILKDICSGNNCYFCYGQDIETILERIKILSIL